MIHDKVGMIDSNPRLRLQIVGIWIMVMLVILKNEIK